MSLLQKLPSPEPVATTGHHAPVSGLVYSSLFFIGLMWVLPFLVGYHHLPLTTFYQEWGAAVFGLCAMSLLVTRRYWQQPKIPRIVWLPIGFLLLLWLQFFMGKMTYLSQTLLVSLYLLWAGLLIMLGQRLREEMGLPALVAALAVFLLLGGELSAAIGIVQKYAWHNGFFDYVVINKPDGAVFANMGQPNHLADYTALALFSLGLLRSHWSMRAWQAVLLAAPLLFVLVLSGSRSAWLYLLAMSIMAFLWQRRDKANRPLLYYSLIVLLGFGLMHFVVKLPWLAGHNSITTVERMVEATGLAGGVNEKVVAAVGSSLSSSIRLSLWYETWIIFQQFPLLGAGFGQFNQQHFQFASLLQNTISPGLYNHAHNVVLETAAEMGMAGLLVLFGTIALWIRQAYRAPRTIYHWWGGGALAVLSIHSLLEYPLFYSYFLGLAAIMLGALDNTSFQLRQRSAGRLSLLALLLLAWLCLFQLWQGYRELEAASAPVVAGNDYERRVNLERLGVIQGLRGLFFRHYIEYAMLENGWDHAADQGAMHERVLHFSPTRPVVYREVMRLVQDGRQAEAQAMMERAIWAYPEGLPANIELLRKQADSDTDPFRYQALLAHALRKREEWQRVMTAR